MMHNPDHSGIPPSVLRRLVDQGVQLVDVRTHCEYAGYHIKGSINIPYDEIGRMRDFILRLNKPVITFSTYGRRSEIAAQRLRALGIVVYNAGTIHNIELALNPQEEFAEL